MRARQKETVMTMGDRIKPARGRDTGEIKGAPTAAVNDPEEAGGSSADSVAASQRRRATERWDSFPADSV
jgi:hypothetical protein